MAEPARLARYQGRRGVAPDAQRARGAAALGWPFLFVSVIAGAADQAHDTLRDKLAAGDYSRRGADTCLGCHDEEEPFPTLDVFVTVHGHPQVDGSPFEMDPTAELPAGLQCEACHGPIGDHGRQILADGVAREPILNFGERGNAEASLQNDLCLQCHRTYERTRWEGSAHELAGMACADCHRIHAETDAVRSMSGQNETCWGCHRSVAADALKRSAHPLRDGQLVCRDCHDPHGTDNDKLNVRATGNETCFKCHAELRGPHLWEHPPVVEDCTICHVPHGSNQPALLVRRPPQLCQACHSSVGHRSFAQGPDQLPPRPTSEFLLAKACLNCHAEVHGSNHPSGNLFRR
ncbi:MAG: DmsE family decaheme c-type cytochrome [Gammaproteobacteria bacterium]|nr:DmsE family decaheme c-type cytochrome [Gammaproteobacteria bacterium]MDE0441791.1 DmsE family decaheme c-type cytochrome [Gammaproteobacteria bacterium]